MGADPRWDKWLDEREQAGTAEEPTHRVHVHLDFTLDVAVPPWGDADEAFAAVLRDLDGDRMLQAATETWTYDEPQLEAVAAEVHGSTGHVEAAP